MVGERHGAGIDGKFGGIEDDVVGMADDVEIDGDGAVEFAGGEVRFES